MNHNQKFEQLLENYLANTASPGEWEQLMQMIKSGEYDDSLKQKIDGVLAKRDDVLNMSPDRAHDLLYKILSAEKHTAKLLPLKSPVTKLWRVAAAAAIILILSVGSYVILRDEGPKQIAKTETNQPSLKNDIAPGKPGAILTLGNGKQIVLDSAVNGNISDDAVKNGNEISYLNAQQAAIENNTMSTPKGRQFELVLSDGSKVWLNAASSITYPTSFTGNERKVQITGEAYFEVAPLSPPRNNRDVPKGGQGKVPFIVKIITPSGDGGEVQVLGTHFNVNAYDDEALIKTTLLEGSVKVINGNQTSLLKPGQQAQLQTTNHKLQTINADVEQAVAWKNGFFSLKKTDMQTFMRMISRWYDVDVEYEGAIPPGTISGKAQRSLSFAQMQKVLQLTDVHFKVEGKKIIVTK